MGKEKIKDKHSKVYRKSYFKFYLTSLLLLFFLMASLSGCRLLLFLEKTNINNFLKTADINNFLRTTDINNISASASSIIWEETESSINNTLEQFEAGFNGCVTDLKAGKESSLAVSESNICSAALYNFYNNLSEQLILFKNTTDSSSIETEKATTINDETANPGQDGDEQAASQDINIQEQPADQQNQTQEEAPASTPDPAAGFELQVLSLINNARNSSGLPSLNLNPTLNSIAKSRCDDMIARDYFSHITPDGKDIKSILVQNGIAYKTTGENLQYCSPPSMAGSELFFNNWMESEIHKANILGSGYTQIGIALSSSADKAIAVLVFLG